MFDRLDTMNGSCINRFASWFAYHLSNFQFRWNWDDWNIALKYESLHPKPKFITETLQYCLRLSYHSKVLESISQTFHKLAPAQPKSHNKFIEENDKNKDNELEEKYKDIQGAEYAKVLLSELKQKCTTERVFEILSEISNESLMDIDGGMYLHCLNRFYFFIGLVFR